jgi:hypothetical protein
MRSAGRTQHFGLRDGEGRRFDETLKDAGLFTIRLDEQGVWFRFHPLLRQTLRAELERRVDPAGISALHRRAGVWFADAGLIDEAVTHALAGEDPATRGAHRRVASVHLHTRHAPGTLPPSGCRTCRGS